MLGTVSLPIWLYFTLFERYAWRATLGKRPLGLAVTTTAGEKPGWQQSIHELIAGTPVNEAP